MIDQVAKRRLSTIGLLISLPLLVIGALVVTSHSPVNWLALTVAGGGALLLQYGKVIIPIALGRLAPRSFWPIVIAILAGFAISMAATALGNRMGIPSSANDNFATLRALPFNSRLFAISRISFSLIGEELFTAALAFPILSGLTRRMGSRQAWFWAALISALLFGMIHFQAYHWNWYQMLVAIGLGRLPFTWAWGKTNSLWGGIIAHVIYDLLLFIPLTLF